MFSILTVLLVSSAEEAAKRAVWEAQRRAALAADEEGGICIPGSAICDKNLLIAVVVVGFLWLSTCGGVSTLVALFQKKAEPEAAVAPAAKSTMNSNGDAKEGEKKEKEGGGDAASAAVKKEAKNTSTAQTKTQSPPLPQQQPNVGVAVMLAVLVLGALVWACSDGSLAAGPGNDALSAADAKMRARLDAMAAPRGGGDGGNDGSRDAATEELAANKAFVQGEMEKQAKHDAKKTKKTRAPRAKVEYSFTLTGTDLGAPTLKAVKAYAEAHSLLGHVFLRGNKVEGRVQGREDRVKATKAWLEGLDGVNAIDWEDALTHPFDKFEIMKMGH